MTTTTSLQLVGDSYDANEHQTEENEEEQGESNIIYLFWIIFIYFTNKYALFFFTELISFVMIFQKTYVLDWDAQADEKSIIEEIDQTQSTKLQEMLAK